jgi:ribosomal protein L40E
MDNMPEKEVSIDSENIFPEKESCDVEIDDLRSEIQFLNSEITSLKSKIGEYYWHSFLKSGEHESELQDVFNGIQSRTDEITALEQDIQIAEDGSDQPIQPPVQIRIDQVICKSCGTSNDFIAKFCSSCGIALEKEVPERSEDKSPESRTEDSGICPLCGAILQDDAIFCYTCGARVKI